jgi:hypothetical protein
MKKCQSYITANGEPRLTWARSQKPRDFTVTRTQNCDLHSKCVHYIHLNLASPSETAVLWISTPYQSKSSHLDKEYCTSRQGRGKKWRRNFKINKSRQKQLCPVYSLEQRGTSTGSQVAVATKFCTVASNICGPHDGNFSIWPFNTCSFETAPISSGNLFIPALAPLLKILFI